MVKNNNYYTDPRSLCAHNSMKIVDVVLRYNRIDGIFYFLQIKHAISLFNHTQIQQCEALLKFHVFNFITPRLYTFNVHYSLVVCGGCAEMLVLNYNKHNWYLCHEGT